MLCDKTPRTTERQSVCILVHGAQDNRLSFLKVAAYSVGTLAVAGTAASTGGTSDFTALWSSAQLLHYLAHAAAPGIGGDPPPPSQAQHKATQRVQNNDHQNWRCCYPNRGTFPRTHTGPQTKSAV